MAWYMIASAKTHQRTLSEYSFKAELVRCVGTFIGCSVGMLTGQETPGFIAEITDVCASSTAL